MPVPRDRNDVEDDDQEGGGNGENETQPKLVQFNEKDKLCVKKGNYKIWKLKIVSIFKRNKCFDIVTGDRARPRRANQLRHEWDTLQEFAFQQIMFNVEDDFLEILDLDDDENNPAHNLWKLITEWMEKMSELDRELIQTKLEKIRVPEGNTLEDHFDKMRKLRVQGSAVGYKLTDREFCRMIIHSLPPSWDSFAEEMYPKTDLEPEELTKLALMSEAVRAERARSRIRQQPRLQPRSYSQPPVCQRCLRNDLRAGQILLAV